MEINIWGGFPPSRCLLIDLVDWIKRELKTLKKKSSLVLIHLTPFAWRSGQTSSMLGGAQFKSNTIDCEAFASNIQCRMTDYSGHKAKGWLATFHSMEVNSSQGLHGPIGFCNKMGPGQENDSYPTQEATSGSQPPYLCHYPGLYWRIFGNANPCCIHMLLKDTALCHRMPHTVCLSADPFR